MRLIAFLSFAFASLLGSGAKEQYTISSVAGVIERIEQARTVELSAYVLSRHGTMSRALLQAAAHGARVHIVLDGVAFGGVRRTNLSTSRLFRAHGIHVDLTDYPLHAKVALVDGCAYLTDRNWASHGQAELVLQDTNPQDLPLVALVMKGQSASNDHFSTRKRNALQLEAAILLSGGPDIALETEAFTAGSVVEAALLQQAHRGARIRLLVNQKEFRQSSKEQRALQVLAQAGVQIRVGPLSEKLAISGRQAWLGSANATPGVPNQIDWGLQVPATLLGPIKSQFEDNWLHAISATRP